MSHRRTTRYENLSDEALLKIRARVRNTRRRSQIKRALTHRGAEA